jgi:hypothetical protein
MFSQAQIVVATYIILISLLLYQNLVFRRLLWISPPPQPRPVGTSLKAYFLQVNLYITCTQTTGNTTDCRRTASVHVLCTSRKSYFLSRLLFCFYVNATQIACTNEAGKLPLTFSGSKLIKSLAFYSAYPKRAL